MEPQKFVVRLLDADAQLLAWTTVYARPQPQGERRSCLFRTTDPTLLPIEQDGLATTLAVHWCDLDLARQVSLMEPTPVKAGTVMQWHWIEPVWLVAGMKDVPLPPVTLRQTTRIGPPTGSLMALAT